MVTPDKIRARKTGRKNDKLIKLNAQIREQLSTGRATAHVPNGVDTVVFNDGNTKVGLSFTLPEGPTCPGQTAACAATCYLKFGSFSFPASRNSRNRNYAQVLRRLKQGSGFLALSLIMALKKAQKNWTTCRIHDGGDFFSPTYTREWTLACEAYYDITFWAYTRSWVVPAILAELKKLAALPNVKVWLSLDADNWMAGTAVFEANPEFAGVAFMQRDGEVWMSEMLATKYPAEKLVIFPVHANAGRVVESAVAVPNCPAIVAHEQFEGNKLPACVQCGKCL